MCSTGTEIQQELRSTAEREELQYAQIKVRIRSIYQIIAPYWRESVDTEDPFKQLQLMSVIRNTSGILE